ncbi:MAG: T9SS type A sorting domain-containing protein [Flavobacteriales bacterium]|nr:T9SS type A sorting domain-containing protein [Flavobacteriales bacterium]
MLRLITITIALLATTLVSAITVTVSVVNQICAYPGRCTANVNGGIPPYSYSWNTGGTTATITGLGPGTYTVTVTDADGQQATANGEVAAEDYTGHGLDGEVGGAYCEEDPLLGQPYIMWMSNSESIGPPPYLFNGEEPWPVVYDFEGMGYDVYYVRIHNAQGQPAAPGETVAINFQDGNGCGGTFTVTGGYPVVWPTVDIVQVNGACNGQPNGSVVVSFGMEAHHYQVTGELRDGNDQVVAYGYNYWHGASAQTYTYTGLAPGNYTLYQRLVGIPELPLYDNCSQATSITIPDYGNTCNSVSGTVFVDNDQDCVKEAGDWGVPNMVLEVLPGPLYTITDGSGAYSMNLVNGSYTIGQGNPTLVQLCPSTSPAPFTINFNPVVLDFADSSTVALDLGAVLQATPMRPGFAGAYWGRVRNNSAYMSGPVTVTLVIDPALTYDGATPTPTDVTGNTITWQFPPLSAFQYMDFKVHVQVPAGTPLGSIVTSTMNVQNGLSDADPTNDAYTLNQTVTGSYDPNDKAGYTDATRSSSQFFLGQDEWIDYTIRFQNTGTDTAFTVVIRDTLDADLDIASLEILGASHAFTPSFGSGRELVFTFNQILLPDSTTDLLGSQGYVAFRIKPHAGLVPGDELANTAAIYFDFNEPVITNTVTHVAEIGTGVAAADPGQVRLMPNPTDGILYVRLPEGTTAAFELLSMDGRRLVAPTTRRSDGLQVDVRSLAPGMYMVRTAAGTARFMKQ